MDEEHDEAERVLRLRLRLRLAQSSPFHYQPYD
jgi:hypothetical protein